MNLHGILNEKSLPIPIENHQAEIGFSHAVHDLNERSADRAFTIINHHTSEETARAYQGDMNYWEAWLIAIGFNIGSLITEKEVISFIVQHAEGLDSDVEEKLVTQGYKKPGSHKLSTIKRRVISLSILFEKTNKTANPCKTKAVKVLFQKLAKQIGGSKPAGKAITKDILDDMLSTCKDTLIDIRDRALLLFAWASGGRRRTEVASADMKDLLTTSNGNFIYTIPRSKTDQEGKGCPVPVKGKAAHALQEWINASGITEGPIFRAINKGGKISTTSLSDVYIHRIVRYRLKTAGYDESQFGAHSIRSGFVTECGRQGKALGDVMAMTTHRNVATCLRYYQSGNIINNSASNLADE